MNRFDAPPHLRLCCLRLREGQAMADRALKLLAPSTGPEEPAPTPAWERFLHTLHAPEGPRALDVALGACEHRLRELEEARSPSPPEVFALLEDLASALRHLARDLDDLALRGPLDLPEPSDSMVH